MFNLEKYARKFCQACNKDRLHKDGECLACVAKEARLLEAQRPGDVAFAHLDPENDG